MRIQRHLAILLLMLAVAAPSVAGQPVALADVTATNFQGSGLSNVMGSTQAATYRSVGDDDRIAFSMTLQADRLHVSVDHAQSLVSAAGAAVEGYLWTDDANFTAATVLLESARPHFKVEVFALPDRSMQVSHNGPCLNLLVPEANAIEASKRTQSPRPIPSVSTDGAVQVGLCPGAMSIKGDFLLVLWETTVTIVTAEEEATIHTGEGMGEARGPQGAVAPAQVPQSDQAYIAVYGGTLRLSLEPGSAGSLQAFLDDGSASLVGVLQASNARGEIFGLAGTVEAVSSQLVVEGDLQLHMDRRESAIFAHVFGEPRKIILDGATLDLSSSNSIAVNLDAPWTAAGSALAAILLLMVGLLRVRRRHPEEPLRVALALDQFNHGRNRLALGLAEASLRGHPSPDAYALKARILYAQKRWAETLEWATIADRHLTDDAHVGKNALVGSFAAARLEKAQQAGWWFRRATSSDPSLANAIDQDEALFLMSTRREFSSAGAASTDDLLRP